MHVCMCLLILELLCLVRALGLDPTEQKQLLVSRTYNLTVVFPPTLAAQFSGALLTYVCMYVCMYVRIYSSIFAYSKAVLRPTYVCTVCMHSTCLTVYVQCMYVCMYVCM